MRIVSLSPAVTETLVLLGLEDDVVGVTPWCRMYLSKPDKEVVGTYLSINVERLKSLKPDIVFIQSRVHERFHQMLRDRGINTYLMPLPTNVYAIISHIVMDVGSLVGRYVESRELAEKLIERLEKVKRESGHGPRPRVYVEYLWPDKTYSTTGSLTFIDDGVRIAGGINVYSDIPREFFNPSDEETVSRDPDAVIVNIEHPFENLTLDQYKEIRRGLSRARPYAENRIYLVRESREVNLAHFGPSFISTVEYLSRLFRSVI